MRPNTVIAPIMSALASVAVLVLLAISSPGMSAQEEAQVATGPARVFAGTCDNLDTTEPVVVLNDVSVPQGNDIGAEEARMFAYSITTTEIALDELTDTAHSVAVLRSEDDTDSVVACGEIGGIPIETGALAIQLNPSAADLDQTGLAYLAPSAGQTVISVYVPLGAPGTPEVGAAGASPEATPVAQ